MNKLPFMEISYRELRFQNNAAKFLVHCFSEFMNQAPIPARSGDDANFIVMYKRDYDELMRKANGE